MPSVGLPTVQVLETMVGLRNYELSGKKRNKGETQHECSLDFADQIRLGGGIPMDWVCGLGCGWGLPSHAEQLQKIGQPGEERGLPLNLKGIGSKGQVARWEGRRR